MKKALLSVVLLFGLAESAALAVDPVENFAKSLVANVDEQYWWGLKEDKPAGGYLLKFEHDITGDGRNELFVASSLDEEEGAYMWSIYSPNEQQAYSKMASNIAIPPADGFYFSNDGSKREVQTVYRNQKVDLGIIDRYTVAANGRMTHVKQQLTPGQLPQLDADTWKDIFGIGDEVKPAISKVLLAEYVNNHAVQWRSYNADLGVAEQNKDPADASVIDSNTGFTLQTAKQLLHVP